MSKKILIITGLTATGKTSLGVDICKKIDGEIVSADSRQVYKYMDIGTGKDIGKAKFRLVKKIDNLSVGYYKIDGVPVWLMDVVEPDYQFSPAEFVKLALEVIGDIESRGKKAVIVGGSGFYITSLLNPPDSLSVKPNFWIRKILNKLGTKNIIKIYKLLDSQGYEKLNKSEQSNRHRLIRKIEIKLAKKKLSSIKKVIFDSKVIYLEASKQKISQNIRNRVEKRVESGLLSEVENLKNKYGWDSPGLNCLAYKEFKPYFEEGKNINDCIEVWMSDEIRYAKRQKTWFKNKGYTEVDIEKDNLKKVIEEAIKWYNLE